MRRFHIIDKTRKDQYVMHPVVAVMKAYGWLQYKKHPVFYKKKNSTDGWCNETNYVIMYPRVTQLNEYLSNNTGIYYAQLVCNYITNHHNKNPYFEYALWRKQNTYIDDNCLENILNKITIGVYKEGGCYTEAIKCCRSKEERNFYGLNNGKYFTLTDFNRWFIRTLHKIGNPWLDLKWWVKDTKRNFYKSIITFLTMPLPEFFTRLFGMHSSQQQNEN